MKRTMTTLLAALAALLVLGYMGQSDSDAEDFDAARYCDMVYQHKLDKSTGWPDYEGTYDAQCVKGELRKP